MLLISRASAAGDSDYGPAFCVIDLTPEYARKLLARRMTCEAARAGDSSLYKLEYWCGLADYYESDEPFDAIGDEMDYGVWYELRGEIPEDTATFRADVTRVTVDAWDAQWVALPKHGSEEFSSEPLPWRTVEAIAEGRPTGLDAVSLAPAAV